MGLDTTHDCWHGAYSAFKGWRDKLAEVAGYTFSDPNEPTAQVQLDWGCIEKVIGHDLLGVWPGVPVRTDGTPDPLIVLLAHSDCEGEIQANMVGLLADRLTEILPLLEGDGGGHIGDYREKTQTFIEGLRRAAERNEDVEFH